MKRPLIASGLLAALAVLAGCEAKKKEGSAATIELQNVSYDPTREFYEEFNAAFAKKWAAEGKGEIKITQSHGGSGKQARAVIDGTEDDDVNSGTPA